MGSQYSRIDIVTLYKLITFCVWEIHFIFTLIPLHYAALHAKTSPSCEDGIIEWKTVSEKTSEKKTDLQKNSLPVPDLNFVIPTKVPMAFCELNIVHVTPSLVIFKISFFSSKDLIESIESILHWLLKQLVESIPDVSASLSAIGQPAHQRSSYRMS